MDQTLRPRDKKVQTHLTPSSGRLEKSESERTNPTARSQDLATMSNKVLEAFLEAQTNFLKEQTKIKEEEEKRPKTFYEAQLKDLHERERLLKLQEEQVQTLNSQKTLEEERKQKSRQADNVEKWRDSDQPDAFFARFEAIMTDCDIADDHWKRRLVNCLTERALEAYRSITRGKDELTYPEFKEKLANKTKVLESE